MTSDILEKQHQGEDQTLFSEAELGNFHPSVLFLGSESPRQVFIERFLRGNIISQWFLTFPES